MKDFLFTVDVYWYIMALIKWQYTLVFLSMSAYRPWKFNFENAFWSDSLLFMNKLNEHDILFLDLAIVFCLPMSGIDFIINV